MSVRLDVHVGVSVSNVINGSVSDCECVRWCASECE